MDLDKFPLRSKAANEAGEYTVLENKHRKLQGKIKQSGGNPLPPLPLYEQNRASAVGASYRFNRARFDPSPLGYTEHKKLSVGAGGWGIGNSCRRRGVEMGIGSVWVEGWGRALVTGPPAAKQWAMP